MGKKKKQQHPSTSHIQNVSESYLKPYINDQLKVIAQQLARQQLAAMADVLTRVSVLEDLTCKSAKVSKKDLQSLVMTKEDEAWGLKCKKTKAEKGDYLRVSVATREAERKEFEKPVDLHIKTLATTYTVLNTVEDAMVGMKAGDTKEVSADLTDSQTTTDKLKRGADAKKIVHYKITVNRVSARAEA